MENKKDKKSIEKSIWNIRATVNIFIICLNWSPKGKEERAWGKAIFRNNSWEFSKLKRIYQAINSTSTKQCNKSKFKETISNTTTVQCTNSKEKQNLSEGTRGKTTAAYLWTMQEITITAYFSTKMINTRK